MKNNTTTMRISSFKDFKREYDLPNVRAVIPRSPADTSATSAGSASECILLASIKPESRYSICPSTIVFEANN